MSQDLKLLVEWSSPWEEFRTAIRPALRKSPAPLAGEARSELFPYRGMLACWFVECVLLIAAIVLPSRIAALAPKPLPAFPKYDVIYFSGDELPQTEDAGGARAGKAGRSGGHEAHHRTQVIRVARGETVREKLVDAPKLDLPSSDAAVANLLAYKPVPGAAPAEGLRSSSRAPSMPVAAVPPAPEVQAQKLRTAPAMSAAVVPPSPSTQQTINAARIPGSQLMAVVPPPVSAPEQVTNFHSQLTLPAPSVVAPPPSVAERDVRTRGPGFGPGVLQQIVPPPVQVGSAMSDRRSVGGVGNASVVPPPVQVNGAANGRTTVASLGSPNVVAPPVEVSGGSIRGRGTGSLGGGTSVAPPPPNISGSGSASGLGRGNRGKGLGGPGDVGSEAAPPSNTGGSVAGNGIVVSSDPGTRLGTPGGVGSGSLALSPNGGAQPGVGSGQGGAGIGQGTGPGSGMSREGPGAANSGTGPGTDAVARSGISPYPGTGGAGTGTVGKPPIPGVSVHGGSNIITLPSFGSDSTSGSASVPGRSSPGKKQEGPDITIVGSSRSGGAFNFYGTLKGDKVYTIYIDTALGTAVLEYSDPLSANHPYGEDLVAPHPIRADLPGDLKRSRLVISCTLDRSGLVRNPRVLEPASHDLTTRVLAALSSWKFRPVFRGSEAIEVTAILGFGVDTR
jgi:hypothetical protein